MLLQQGQSDADYVILTGYVLQKAVGTQQADIRLQLSDVPLAIIGQQCPHDLSLYLNRDFNLIIFLTEKFFNQLIPLFNGALLQRRHGDRHRNSS